MSQLYDRIGLGYARTRRPDPRIAAELDAALGTAGSVVNVGAGAGAYEPTRRRVVAVEPSIEMIRQRPRSGGPVVQAVAERLPFRDRAFDAGLVVLSAHHWSDPEVGFRELRRVVQGRVVLLTWDPSRRDRFWLTAEYLPAILDLDALRFPPLEALTVWLGPVEVRPVTIPRDCQDGFLGSFWARPEAYLDPAVRRGISSFAQLEGATVEAGLRRLTEDLASGRWEARFGHLRREPSLDLGYRLVTAGPDPPSDPSTRVIVRPEDPGVRTGR